MFSKHVWYDRKHQAEVFITDDGVVSGAILAYRGAVCVVNPRPEILSALYQESKLKRILSLRTVILTDNTIDYARGLCVLLSYSRGLRRRTPLTVITRENTRLSTDFLSSSCSRLLQDIALFKVDIVRLASEEQYRLGDGAVWFESEPADRNPRLVLKTPQETLHFLDDTHTEPAETVIMHGDAHPNVIIRTAELSVRARRTAHSLTVVQP